MPPTAYDVASVRPSFSEAWKAHPYPLGLTGIAFLVGCLSLFMPNVAQRAPSALLLLISVYIVIATTQIQKTDLLLANTSSVLARPLALDVFETWQDHRVWDIVSSATASVTILDTWFDNTTELDGALTVRNKAMRTPLKLTVYMLRDSCIYGRQRINEIESVRSAWRDDDTTRQEYSNAVNSAARQLERMARQHDVELTIRYYCAMPSVRAVIVDDKDIILSWFPAGRNSASNPCIYVDGSREPSTVRIIGDGIRSHVAQIDEWSQDDSA
jgi:hypothetical protein